MSKQTINIGASPNDGTGTPLRTSFDYCNLNFTELYTALGGGVGLPGATTQVIFNDGGTNLAGDAGLVFDKTTDKLTIAGNVQAASATITGDLTVDTSTLKVDSANNRVGIGTATPNWPLSIVGSSPEFVMLDSGGNGSRFYTKATNTAIFIGASYSTSSVPINFTLDGGSSNAMTLNSTGLGIGVTPSAIANVIRLEIGGALSTNLTLRSSSGNASARNWMVGSNVNAFGDFVIRQGNSQGAEPNSGTDRLVLDASGRLLVGPTSANASGGVLQLSSGITFPATQVASSDVNTLDDYEEGTWTGTLKGSTTDPTVPVTATGRYTKIGRQILIEISFTNVSTVGAAGAISIAMTGLPGVTATRSMGNVSAWLGATFTGTLQAMIIEGTSVISLVSSISNAANGDATHNAGTGRYFWITASFTV